LARYYYGRALVKRLGVPNKAADREAAKVGFDSAVRLGDAATKKEVNAIVERFASELK
jgi:hypothetical protein